MSQRRAAARSVVVVAALLSTGCAGPGGPKVEMELVRSERAPGLTPDARRLTRLAARARASVVQIRSEHRAVKSLQRYLAGLAEGFSGLLMPHPYWEWPYRVAAFPFYLLFGYLDLGTSWGTGFYVSRDLVLTNAHVLTNAGAITVRLPDGRRARGSVEAIDPSRDIALVRVHRLPHRSPDPGNAGRALPPPTPLRLRRSSARPGEPVMVVGFPTRDVLEDPNLPRARFDPNLVPPNPRITVGIVSARDVHLGNPYTRYVETDAALNPGNSGGPVLGLDGSVLGVASMVGIGKENEGFAIPAITVLATFKQQLSGEPAQRVRPELDAKQRAPQPEEPRKKGKRG